MVRSVEDHCLALSQSATKENFMAEMLPKTASGRAHQRFGVIDSLFPELS